MITSEILELQAKARALRKQSIPLARDAHQANSMRLAPAVVNAAWAAHDKVMAEVAEIEAKIERLFAAAR